MAISNPTLLDTKTLQTADKLNSASISPSANALLIIVHCVEASFGSGWTDSVSDSFGANLGDWTSVDVEIDGAVSVHMWMHYAQAGATPGSGTVSVDPSAGDMQIMFVLELTGHNTTSPVTQYKTYSSDATPTSPKITLGSSPASGSLVLGAIGGGPGTTSSGATSGTGFTELADTRVAGGGGIGSADHDRGFTELADKRVAAPRPTVPVTSCAVQYDNGGADTTCDWSLSNYGQTITGIALEIAAASGASPVSITLDKAAVTASGKALSITKGAVSITLAKAALTAAGKALSVTAPIPPTSITLAKAALTASGKALTVTPGAVSVTLDKAALIASGKAATIAVGATTITLDKASITASGKALTVTPGAVSVTLDKAALVASGKSLMVTPGAVSVTLDKAGLTAAGKSLTVMPGAVSVTLDKAALIAAGKKVTVTATAAITVTLGKATITASGKSLTVTPGAVSISLDKAAILTAGKSIAVSAPAPDTGGYSAWAYNRWKESELREYLESEDELVILLASAEVVKRGRG